MVSYWATALGPTMTSRSGQYRKTERHPKSSRPWNAWTSMLDHHSEGWFLDISSTGSPTKKVKIFQIINQEFTCHSSCSDTLPEKNSLIKLFTQYFKSHGKIWIPRGPHGPPCLPEFWDTEDRLGKRLGESDIMAPNWGYSPYGQALEGTACPKMVGWSWRGPISNLYTCAISQWTEKG